MPENLRTLKGRIRTAKNIAQLAKTLETVSVSKIRRARTLAETVRPYAERITVLTENAMGSLGPEERRHPYLAAEGGFVAAEGGFVAAEGGSARSPVVPARLVLAIGPDKGLCGPLTGNLVRKLVDAVDEHTLVITVGKKMENPAVRLAGSRLIASFPMGARLPQFSLVFELVRVINEQILKGKAASLDVLYGRFVSFFTQTPTVQRLLPLAPTPAAARAEELEPGSEEMVAALLPHYLEVRLFDAVVQAFSAEHAARMVAMQSAKDNASDIAETYTLLYNKTRQERITSEILDLANKGKRE
jgi:F-type H+-transporting ATPase subunit gamma